VSVSVAVAVYTVLGVAGRLTIGVVMVSVLLEVAYHPVRLAWFGLHRCW
jgi:hypothetical protein